jgi:hypothetical protein
MFKRRLGPDPHADGGETPNTPGCPDIWELESGEFVIIGKDVTVSLGPQLPATASCGPDERVIVLPRRTLIAALVDIPTK